MAPLFGLLGLFCLGAAVYGLFRPEKVAFFVSEPTRKKVVGFYITGALVCFAAVATMTFGESNPAMRGPSRSRYALPSILPGQPPAIIPQPDGTEEPAQNR